MTFNEFNLSRPLVRALEEKGYKTPTPIQQRAIPSILNGNDILGTAQTGTGKTAAFCIPLLEILNRSAKGNGIRSLILTPTRELAIQISENLRYYAKHMSLRSALIYGGVSQIHQEKELRQGVDIVIATPGRLLDLINQRIVSLKNIQFLVLDEADRMLDMGFYNDIKKLLNLLPETRQNVFFSATMPTEVEDLAKRILKKPVTISIANTSSAVVIDQSVYYVPRESKRALLKYVITQKEMKNVIVFARTKHSADRIAKDLNKSGIPAEAFHGDKSQNARQRALSNFKQNSTRVLVATDIAARGIDIADLPFVINYEMPQSAETYTHRIGRTGRAGQSGSALSFCDNDERGQLKNINRISSAQLTVIEHPFL